MRKKGSSFFQRQLLDGLASLEEKIGLVAFDPPCAGLALFANGPNGLNEQCPRRGFIHLFFREEPTSLPPVSPKNPIPNVERGLYKADFKKCVLGASPRLYGPVLELGTRKFRGLRKSHPQALATASKVLFWALGGARQNLLLACTASLVLNADKVTGDLKIYR